jgi:ferredoxin-NADP reductase/predicted pyridoxine 5'-phosphate oxidase superfamily flavin-nucleotide-binding protein
MASLTATAVVPVYPPTWPDTPFHSGELELQERFGVREEVHSYAPRVVRPFLPEQHQDFYQSLPFLAVAARDQQGNMWSSLLMNNQGQAGFVTSPTSTTLSIHAQAVPGDALEKSLTAGTDLGILGIEFANKRRNRVNGRITHSNADQIDFQVDQSFGNCPQYIRPRTWWTAHPIEDATQVPTRAVRADQLTREQMETIRRGDTLFVASGYRGDGENVRFGNDASHRGGASGWIHVKNATTLFLPDYAGNNHYNTMGNLYMDNRMGITIPQFDTGGMIQLTGRAILHLDQDEAAKMCPGALHVIEFHVKQVVELPKGSLPVQWTQPSAAQRERKLQVIRKVKESNDVTSFHLAPTLGDKLWPYKPGQHLPIVLPIDGDKTLMRTYSLSSGTNWGEYRISVKREPFGQASRFLHDTVQVGDAIQASEPAGDFVLNQDSDKTLVLISVGIGVTPVLSMLHSLVHSESNNRKVIWVHGARDGKHHAFQNEVLELTKLIGDFLKTHVVYSQPKVDDDGYDTMGRMDANLLRELVPDFEDADYYMCGTAAFMADMEDGLQKLGVPSKQIQYETF